MTDTWGHWCYEQDPVRLPVSTPRCSQCGALNLNGANIKTITNARLASIAVDDDGLGTFRIVDECPCGLTDCPDRSYHDALAASDAPEWTL